VHFQGTVRGRAFLSASAPVFLDKLGLGKLMGRRGPCVCGLRVSVCVYLFGVSVCE